MSASTPAAPAFTSSRRRIAQPKWEEAINPDGQVVKIGSRRGLSNSSESDGLGSQRNGASNFACQPLPKNVLNFLNPTLSRRHDLSPARAATSMD